MKLADELRSAAGPAIRQAFDDSVDQFLGAIGGLVQTTHHPKVAGLYKSAADYRYQALTAATPEDAALALDLCGSAVRSIKTLLIAERIVAEDKMAQAVADIAWAILDTAAKVAKGALQAVVAGAVQGLVTGLTGGAAPAVGGAASSIIAEVFRGK